MVIVIFLYYLIGVSLEPDFNGDINKFELKLNFLAIILLHQDVLLSSDEVHLPDSYMVDQMKTLAEQFFSYCSASDLSSYVRNDVRYEQFMAVVERNHFRFVLIPYTLILQISSSSFLTVFKYQIIIVFKIILYDFNG